ncbi:hypothetical protein OKA05_06765 [Luteolibacter arcticus]|uniref:DUF4410 domain-containing protein n=1 Tax=Luteolibacter arcticus TaxID=1581411 RepID=A0ABT3GG61_9BACT|nr:hypothetical protein [Luteolibacter arcticus]MCW1922248.1 hypothetical protein [Luteolibacter arcticus]
MNSTCLRFLAAPVVALAFSSCAQSSWSEAQKSQLSTVSLSQPVVKAGAMKPVSGIDSPGASSSVPMATGGGIIPALIGTAIDAGVTAHQKSEFEKQYGQQLEKLNASLPKSLDKKLRASAEKMLRGDEFFGPRLKDSSPNRFSGELVTYGLMRFHRTNDETHLGASLSVQVKLTDASGKTLFEQPVIGRSTNSIAVGELAAQPKKVDALFDEAAANFALQLKSALDRKLNR